MNFTSTTENWNLIRSSGSDLLLILSHGSESYCVVALKRAFAPTQVTTAKATKRIEFNKSTVAIKY